MTWRLARLNTDVGLSDETAAVDYEQRVADPLAGRGSLLSGFKRRFSSDEDLAEQLQSGNPEALAALFTRHSQLLFGIARRVLRNDAEAEDTVQQVFLDVFCSINQFDRGKGSFKTWLLMFAYHRTFNSRRRQIAQRFFDTDPLEDAFLELSATCKDDPIGEKSILIEQVLRSLQPRQRRTIELVYYEGLTADEISSKTGESVRVVRHNLYRGLDKLRKRFHGNNLGPTAKGVSNDSRS